MPEEINRLVTDRLADLLLTPSRDASATLRTEGEPEEEIEFVGNVMIDSLMRALPAARASGFRDQVGANGNTIVVTLHRPSNVDEPKRLAAIVRSLTQLAADHQIVFPVHPRTRQRLADLGGNLGAIRLMDPIGYLSMLDLVQGAYAVVTDSGGLQEETTALGVPCFTLRANTERPVTISEGTNELVPDPDALPNRVSALRGAARRGRVPEGWDGKAAERIVEALAKRHGVEQR
jgi:UDP-N-acetylglucosamine 2-epimerase (non-hydrolysing)